MIGNVFYIWMDKIRKMILRFINNIQDKILTTYQIRVDFKTIEQKPTHYRLELLAELRNEIELGNLKTILLTQISNNFNLMSIHDNEVKTQHEKNRIENDFKDKLKKHISMKFIFRQWVKNEIGQTVTKVIDETIPYNGVKDYRVNILKSGKIPFSALQDMFVIEIDTKKFK